MTDQDGMSSDLITDKLIDDIVAHGQASDGVAAPDLTEPYEDGQLVLALAQLSPVEWPADETGDVIADRLPLARRRRRHGRTVAITIGSVAAAAVLAAGAVLLSAGPVPSQAGPSPRVTRPTSPSPAQTSPAQRTVAVMAVVSQPGALRAVGVIGSNNDFLFCATRRICYIQGYRGTVHPEVARTLNGGVTWSKGAALPVIPANEEWDAQMSCPKPLTCFSGYGSGLLTTTDGFAHGSVLPVTSPHEQLGPVSCPTTHHCVAVVYHTATGTGFLYTTDGGATWAAASSPPIATAVSIGDLKCDQHSSCIALLLGGTERAAKVSALSSTDGGKTWNVAPRFASIGEQEEWRFDCGDARDCVVTGNDGNFAWIHADRAGHVSIRVQPYPKTWPPSGDAVSCVTGRDCFIEVTDIVGGQAYTDNLIEVTHDAGRTWAGVIKTPIASTFLSCPVRVGCVAVAPKNPSNLVVLSNLLGGH